MKAALIMPTYFAPGSVLAGGERYAHGLAKALSEKIETSIFTFGNENKEMMDGKLRVRYCRTLFLGGGIANPFSIAHIAELKNFDVVHCLQFKTLVTESALWAAAFFGKKSFVTDLAGGTHYCFSRFLPTEKLVREFLLISEFNRSLNRTTQRPSRIIFGGVDTAYFSPSPQTRGTGRFLYVGRIFRGKGIHHLIEALPEEDSLDIAGQCHDQAYFEELKVLARGKQIFFHDSLPDSEILEKYQTAAALVLPSLVDGGFTSAMEAMACGIPVIGASIGSLPEVVEHEKTGLLVPSADVQALRKAMMFMRENPDAAREMGGKARQSVLERFTWGKTAERCLEAYEDRKKNG